MSRASWISTGGSAGVGLLNALATPYPKAFPLPFGVTKHERLALGLGDDPVDVFTGFYVRRTAI
jgi:hypothetical protein